MALNGSGTFSRLYSWVTDAAAGTRISSSRMDAEMDGMATALSTALYRDGQATPTANIPMGGYKLTGLGAATATGDALAQNKQCNGLLDISGAAAGQIKFPATQNASSDVNTLDDYEEGTFTPSIGGTATYSTQLGYYTKVGRIVTFVIRINIFARGTGSQYAITGMPFAPGISGIGGSVGWWTDAGSTFVSVGWRIPTSSTTLYLVGLTSGAISVNTTPAFFVDNTEIYINGFYYV